MKQRKLIAIILTIILTLATVLTVFAAFRFEVQFPSKLNTYKFDPGTASFSGSFDADITFDEPGDSYTFKATIENMSDKSYVTTVNDGGQSEEVPGGDATYPVVYQYKLSLPADYSVETNKVLLSSILVYLNGKIQGTLYSILAHETERGLIGDELYVLPESEESDEITFELHLASDATPYKNVSLPITVNCTATNHNAQEYSFVNSTEKLIQAISEVNRGAQNKTIVLYGGFNTAELADGSATPDAQLTVKAPCTFDVQDVTFGKQIIIDIASTSAETTPEGGDQTDGDEIDGDQTDGDETDGDETDGDETATESTTPAKPTDIVTVLSTKGAYEGNATGFTITAGAIDRKDSVATTIHISNVAAANAYSVQYIIDNQLDIMLAHGISAGDTNGINIADKGFSCYIQSIVPQGSLLSYTDGKLTAASTNVSKVESLTVTLTSKVAESEGSANLVNVTHTHTVKVIGHNDAELQNLLNDELKYIKDLTVAGTDVSFSIPLPTVIKSKNATIEWHSSDPEKFSSQGVCSPSANGYVTLTAVIRINEAVYTEHFKIHIATLTNEDRLEAMIAAMGNLTLNTIWNGAHQSGKLDQVFMPITTQQTDGSWKQTFVDSNGVTQELSSFDITNIELTIDEEAYGYIGFQNGTEFVVLDYASFQTMALVNIKATFATGEPKEVPSTICVNIQLGSDTSLGDQVLEYVQSQMNNVNVLQNMLDTRATDEKGDFTLPTEYNGFEIVYTISGETAASVSGGNFTVYPEHFETSYYSVPVDVKVLIKGATEVTEENTIASRTMYFDVPPVITTDPYGFENVALFKEVRKQVNNSLVIHNEQWTDADANNKYILLRDIEKCTKLSIDGTSNGTSSINGLAYFANLTVFEATNFNSGLATQLARASATYTNLTELKLSKIGLADITPLQSLTGLTKLDISGNTNLSDITGLVNYDATKLAELNISGTAVNMTHARPMLTDMYYKYMSGNSNATPEYYYTHEYTPIADGALLLEPDAISVSGGVATISGTKILISNIELANGQLIALEGGASIQIDGEKSIAVPENTAISGIKGTPSHSADTNSAVLTDAIISFNLGADAEKSTMAALVNKSFTEVITITDVIGNVNGATVTVGANCTITAGSYTNNNVPAGEIPILYGVISQNGTTVTITPLKEGNNYRPAYIGITDDAESGNSTIADTNDKTLSKIEISGASLVDNYINVGANGGTITVTHVDNAPFTFVVAANTNIYLSEYTQVTTNNSTGIITLTPVKMNTNPVSVSSEIVLSAAEITNVTTNGVTVPTITTKENCVMTINGMSITLPAGIPFSLPDNAVGVMNGNVVKIQTAQYSGVSLKTTDKTFEVLNATLNNDNDYNGWEQSGTIYRTASATIEPTGNGAAYIFINNTWIPFTSTSIQLKGSSQGALSGDRSKWGVLSMQNNIVSVKMGEDSQISSTVSYPTTNVSFDFTSLGLSASNPMPLTVTLPTTQIYPTHAGIITVEEQNSSEMSSSSAVYYSNEKPTVFGGTWDEESGAVALTYDWSAILADGEFITLSNTPSSVAIELVNGMYKITVTGGTSTIGKGALVSESTDANVTYNSFDTSELKIQTIINDQRIDVTVNYTTENGFTHALVNGMIFEPLTLSTPEKQGLSFLYLLGEIPDVTHFQIDGHGSFIQLASTVHYGGGGQSVKVAWEIWDDGIEGTGAAIVRNDYFGYPRIETVNQTGITEITSYEVTLRAQVNVQGLVTYRYFTFTVTYYPEVTA